MKDKAATSRGFGKDAKTMNHKMQLEVSQISVSNVGNLHGYKMDRGILRSMGTLRILRDSKNSSGSSSRRKQKDKRPTTSDTGPTNILI
jgi:hypothetical protein